MILYFRERYYPTLSQHTLTQGIIANAYVLRLSMKIRHVYSNLILCVSPPPANNR